MKKRGKIILVIIILAIVVLAALVYFLLFTRSGYDFGTSLGFSMPDYSRGANLGDVVGQGTNSNPYEDVKLNPFKNET